MTFFFLPQSVKSVCHAGCAVIAAVTLRSPDNAKQVMAAGGADLITQVMKTHANEPVIQVSARAISLYLYPVFHSTS